MMAADDKATKRLAQHFADAYADNPELTVDDLAAQFQVEHDEAAAVLTDYAVEGGRVAYAGPGAGGGWIPAPE